MIAEKEANDLKGDKSKEASAPVYAPQMKLTVYGNSPQKDEVRGQRMSTPEREKRELEFACITGSKVVDFNKCRPPRYDGKIRPPVYEAKKSNYEAPPDKEELITPNITDHP